MSKVLSISPQCITQLDDQRDYKIYVLEGAPEALVSERYLRNKYETNRDIKYWSTYFLLKAMTTSGEIQNWRAQRQLILPFLQMNEPTFYGHLKALKEKGLVTVDRRHNLFLVSYRKAAQILEIPFEGTTCIPYNPFKHDGKQVFQYFLRAEEFRFQQQRQLNALMYYLDKNPLLKNDLFLLLLKQGADERRLQLEPKYFQERLLELQMGQFRHGSEILEHIFTLRADINRGVRAIKKNHSYRSAVSVSYMKRRMWQLKIVQVRKICVESKHRCRIYIPDEQAASGRRDGYKWLSRKANTAWFLTDQIFFNYETRTEQPRERQAKKAA